MMVSQISQSVEEGYDHYNRYAKAKGFSVRLDDKEYIPGTKELKQNVSSAQTIGGFDMGDYRQSEVDGFVRYVVMLKDGEGGTGHPFFVECSVDGSPVNGGMCGCRKMACEAILCANSHVWSAEMGRYRDPRNKASAALFKASMSTERSQQVMDFLQTILDEPVENDENTKETTFGPTPSHYCAFSRASGERVLDPKVIVPKPPSKKTMKPFHETLRESNGHKKRTRR